MVRRTQDLSGFVCRAAGGIQPRVRRGEEGLDDAVGEDVDFN